MLGFEFAHCQKCYMRFDCIIHNHIKDVKISQRAKRNRINIVLVDPKIKEADFRDKFDHCKYAKIISFRNSWSPDDQAFELTLKLDNKLMQRVREMLRNTIQIGTTRC